MHPESQTKELARSLLTCFIPLPFKKKKLYNLTILTVFSVLIVKMHLILYVRKVSYTPATMNFIFMINYVSMFSFFTGCVALVIVPVSMTCLLNVSILFALLHFSPDKVILAELCKYPHTNCCFCTDILPAHCSEVL